MCERQWVRVVCCHGWLKLPPRFDGTTLLSLCFNNLSTSLIFTKRMARELFTQFNLLITQRFVSFLWNRFITAYVYMLSYKGYVIIYEDINFDIRVKIFNRKVNHTGEEISFKRIKRQLFFASSSRSSSYLIAFLLFNQTPHQHTPLP